MNTYQIRTPQRRKHMSATMFGAVVITLAIGGIAQTAVSQAAWDIDSYDRCVRDFNGIVKLCCTESGGEWDEKLGKCVAPLTAQTPTQSPGEIYQVPGTGTFGQTDPAPPNNGQAPQSGTATQSQPDAPGPILPHPWLR